MPVVLQDVDDNLQLIEAYLEASAKMNTEMRAVIYNRNLSFLGAFSFWEVRGITCGDGSVIWLSVNGSKPCIGEEDSSQVRETILGGISGERLTDRG